MKTGGKTMKTANFEAVSFVIFNLKDLGVLNTIKSYLSN